MSKLRNIVVVGSGVAVVAAFFDLSPSNSFFCYFIKLEIDVECEISLNMNRISFWHLTVRWSCFFMIVPVRPCVCVPECCFFVALPNYLVANDDRHYLMERSNMYIYTICTHTHGRGMRHNWMHQQVNRMRSIYTHKTNIEDDISHNSLARKW